MKDDILDVLRKSENPLTEIEIPKSVKKIGSK